MCTEEKENVKTRSGLGVWCVGCAPSVDPRLCQTTRLPSNTQWPTVHRPTLAFVRYSVLYEAGSGAAGSRPSHGSQSAICAENQPQPGQRCLPVEEGTEKRRLARSA